ncbi:MAG TPA: hypothetical protein VKW76_06555 [Candidatus Binatia bacterium]|nr:hypothetical protein [Candidatus Binatia bacterium]
MVTVELVCDQGCPNAEEARITGLAAQCSEWTTSSDTTPAHLRRYGSPTVLVNGRDVAGAEPGEAESCRVYEGNRRRSGVPPTELIVSALAAADQPKGSGVGFIPTTPYLLPLTVAFLFIALGALAFRAETRTALALGVVASDARCSACASENPSRERR